MSERRWWWWWWWIGSLTLALAAFRFPSTLTLASGHGDSLDYSWLVSGYWASSHHLSFTNEYIWTYGPLGFLINPIEMDRFLLLACLAARIVSLLALVVAIVILLRRTRMHIAGSALVVLALLFPAGPLSGPEFQTELIGTVGLLLAETIDDSQRRLRIGILVVATAALTTAPLIKASLLPVTVVVLVAWLVQTLIRRRFAEVGAVLGSLVVVWFAVFMLFGGGIVDALTWPIAEFPVLTGYDAMSLPASPVDIVLAVLVSIALVAACAKLLSRPALWWLPTAVVAILFEGFKEAFGRAFDAPLSPKGRAPDFFVLGLWCAFAVTIALRWRAHGEATTPTGHAESDVASNTERHGLMRRVSVFWVNASPLVVMGFCATVLVSIDGSIVPSYASVDARLHQTVDAVHYIVSSSYVQAQNAAARTQAQANYPGLTSLIPRISGKRVFAWPWDGNATLAAGELETLPPVPQEYQAYTSELDAKDAQFFESANRPQWGLVAIEAIDGRLPLQTAGEAFAALLTCYQPVVQSQMFLLVHATGINACLPHESSGPWHRATMGTDIAVPRHRGCITFVHVQPHSTLQGAVLSFLYQQHPIYASLVLSDNEKRSFRMVAGTLPDGIMISNVLSELPSIQDLWAGSTGDVRSFSLVAPPSQWAQQFDYEFSYLPIIGSNH